MFFRISDIKKFANGFDKVTIQISNGKITLQTRNLRFAKIWEINSDSNETWAKPVEINMRFLDKIRDNDTYEFVFNNNKLLILDNNVGRDELVLIHLYNKTNLLNEYDHKLDINKPFMEVNSIVTDILPSFLLACNRNRKLLVHAVDRTAYFEQKFYDNMLTFALSTPLLNGEEIFFISIIPTELYHFIPRYNLGSHAIKFGFSTLGTLCTEIIFVNGTFRPDGKIFIMGYDVYPMRK